VLDLDATDIPLYGHQPERFFHGSRSAPIVRVSVRRVLLQLSSAYPWKDLYSQAFHALRC